MKRIRIAPMLAIAGIATTLFLAATPAHAQWYYRWPPGSTCWNCGPVYGPAYGAVMPLPAPAYSPYYHAPAPAYYAARSYYPPWGYSHYGDRPADIPVGGG